VVNREAAPSFYSCYDSDELERDRYLHKLLAARTETCEAIAWALSLYVVAKPQSWRVCRHAQHSAPLPPGASSMPEVVVSSFCVGEPA
jgi:hypothetical protein